MAHALARVQNIAVAAVTGSWREEYRAACSRLGLEEDLGARRLKMCKNCVQETATNSRHQDQFTWQNNPHQTRSKGKSGWSRLQDQAPPQVCPTFPDPAAQRRDSLVHNCLFGLLTLHYLRGCMGLFLDPPVIWDYTELHQTSNTYPIYMKHFSFS